MPWVKIDDQMPHHRKFMEIRHKARTAAIGVYVMGLCYCNDQLADGFIPTGYVEGIYGGLAAANNLVAVGLWDEVGNGYVVHDYETYQPSRAFVTQQRKELSAARSAAGKLGAMARWGHKEADDTAAPSDSKHGKPKANG